MKDDFDRWLLDESPDAVIATSADGVIAHWTKGAEAVFGYASAEVVGKRLDEITVPPDRREEERQALRQATEAGLFTYESVRRKKDGSLVRVVVSAKAVRDESGALRCILFSEKDVTQLKLPREAQRMSASFGGQLESMPDASVMANAAGRIVESNTLAETIFGYAPGELRGKPVETLIPPRFRTSHVGHRADHFGQLRPRSMGADLDLCGLRKDGAEFPVEISFSSLQTEDGPLELIAIRDITERKRFEGELRAKISQLQAANDELESFSYSISHDLRAPVRAMTGFAGMLIKDLGPRLSGSNAVALERIRENATRMGRLIDGLLAFSNLNRQPLRKNIVPLGPLVQGVLDELRADLSGRRVEIEIAPLPDCHADVTLLRQIFTNLLSNAIKYTRQREVALIKVGAHSDESCPVYFVEDNGAGFDMEYATKLFRVFQRLHPAEQFEGTGIGLAIVQRIVQRHGGRIWAEAEVNRGATFFFTLGNDTENRALAELTTHER